MKHVLVQCEKIGHPGQYFLLVRVAREELPSKRGVLLIDNVFSTASPPLLANDLVDRTLVFDFDGDTDVVLHDVLAKVLGTDWHVVVVSQGPQ